jgi:hypothetical protein
MKKLALVPLLVVLLGPALDERASVLDCFSTPQSTVTVYWQRMIEGRHRDALDCFVEGNRGDLAGMLGLPELVELRCRDFRLHWLPGGQVDLNYDIEYRIAMGESLQRFASGDRLYLTGTGWKIARPLVVAAQRP